MIFPRIENLNIENDHENKTLSVSQKLSLTWPVSLDVIKMSQNPPWFFNLFRTVGPSLATSLEPKAYHWNVTS